MWDGTWAASINNRITEDWTKNKYHLMCQVVHNIVHAIDTEYTVWKMQAGHIMV